MALQNQAKLEKFQGDAFRNIIEFTNKLNAKNYYHLSHSCRFGRVGKIANDQYYESGQNNGGNYNDENDTGTDADIDEVYAGENDGQKTSVSNTLTKFIFQTSCNQQFLKC